MVLNLTVGAAQRRRTTYLLGLVVWLLAVSLRVGGAGSVDDVTTAMVAYPVVFVLAGVLSNVYDAVLR
jgi:hypothetical protein